MKKLTPLGTKTAILVAEDRLEILPPLRTYEVYYEDHLDTPPHLWGGVSKGEK